MLQRNVVEQQVTEANFQGKLADLRAGELRSAFGISNRVNYSLFEPDPLYIATETAEGETEVSEIYGEILYPVFGRFELEVGARLSDFETGDWSFDAKSYKALFNWVASDSWRFRGGWQRANRVPNVAELYAGATSQVFGWGRNRRRVHGQYSASMGQHRRESEPRSSSRAVPATHLSVRRHSGSERFRHSRCQQLPERWASLAAQLSPDHGR